MSRSSCLFSFFLLYCVTILAQDPGDGSLLGRVVDKGEAVADVHVLNISAGKATITNEEGYFALPAQKGDTLLFSAVQLKRTVLVVTPAMLQSQGIIVPIDEYVNVLDEVVVMPYNLTGDISRDLQQMPGDKVLVASTLGLPNAYVKPATQTERKLHEATTGGGIVPLNPVINAISGRTRYLKEMLAVERTYARTQRVRNFYPDSLFVIELKIPETKIADFMYYCEVDTLFQGVVDTADRLQIWEFLKRKSQHYRKNNSLD